MTKKVTKKEKQLEDSAPHDDYHEKEDNGRIITSTIGGISWQIN